jgi:peptide alpha-N-acetyltransferase
MASKGTDAKEEKTSGVLPRKEQELFRTLVQCYEKKAYNKGIKTANAILTKFPQHGETLSMKGLISNCMGKRDEAHELCKQGLRNGLKSSITWHVYGLLHKSDKNIKEASKCYLNALRIDPSNQNILRDLATLQLQMRDLAGFVLTRRKLLDARPSVGTSWIAYAVGHYLMGEHGSAYDVIAKFLEGVTQDSDKKNPEEKHAESELLLFQNRCEAPSPSLCLRSGVAPYIHTSPP